MAVGSGLQAHVEVLAVLLRRHEKRLLSIACLGAVAQGRFFDVQSPPVPSPSEPSGIPDLTTDLSRRLEVILTEDNLEVARSHGLHVGIPGGQLYIRAAVLVDGSADGAETQEVLRALRAAVDMVPQPLPVRLACVAIKRAGTDMPLDQWLQEARSERLEPVSVALLDRHRSDGSLLGEEDARHAAALLMFLGLLPETGDGGWSLHQWSEAHPSWHTYGLCTMGVPLLEVEEALGCALAADVLPLLSSAPDPANTPEGLAGRFKIDALLGEDEFWKHLFTDIPVDLLRSHGGNSLLQCDCTRVRFISNSMPGTGRTGRT